MIDRQLNLKDSHDHESDGQVLTLGVVRRFAGCIRMPVDYRVTLPGYANVRFTSTVL